MVLECFFVMNEDAVVENLNLFIVLQAHCDRHDECNILNVKLVVKYSIAMNAMIRVKRKM